MIDTELFDRVQRHARAWSVVIDDVRETPSGIIAFGSRNGFESAILDAQPIVLKVIKRAGDEWHSGEILAAFDGSGTTRVCEHLPGAILMERAVPGYSLIDLTVKGGDEEAIAIIAGVIDQMHTQRAGQKIPSTCATVEDWGKGFARYIASGDDRLSMQLVEAAQGIYSHLCVSQGRRRMLHGDLQHYNVLFDAHRGWLAIDPKGVIGEIEYELGATLRNPVERPDLFTSPAIIGRRLKQLTTILNLSYDRALAWAFAQAVLSAIWDVEDRFSVEPSHPALRLANVLQTML